MRYLIIALSCATLLAGCQSSSHLEKNSGELTATLPKVDVDKEPGLLDQYRLGGFTVGGWVNQKLGQTFAPVKPKMSRQQLSIFTVQTRNGIVKKLQPSIYL